MNQWTSMLPWILSLPMALIPVPLSAGETKETYSFSSRRAEGVVDRVSLTLEVGGELSIPEKDKIGREKMSVTCTVAYDEQTLALAESPEGTTRSLRYYERAGAVVKVGSNDVKPQLRDQRRLVGVEIEDDRVVLFSPEGPLTREELDLIDTFGNSLLLERLLPEGPVALEASWPLSKSLLAALLGLDAVAKADVTCVLKSVDDEAARFQMSGTVEGAVAGVATEIEVKAKYRFDRRIGRIDWLGLLVKERRDVGHVMQGLDAVARLQVRILPQPNPPELLTTAAKNPFPEPIDALSRLLHQSTENGFEFLYDRRWNITNEEHDLVILRLIDRGRFLAQCNISPLAKIKPGKQETLESFQKDIHLALGEQFGEFVEAGQWANEADYRILRVVVRGEVSELPIQWHYYLVADKHGHQVALAFSVETELVDSLGQRDKELVGTLRFLGPEVAMHADHGKDDSEPNGEK